MPDSDHLSESNSAPRTGQWTRIGLIILGISLLFWASLPLIPFLPLTTGKKALLGGILFVIAEVTFWGGAILAGKEAVQKYQDRFNPFKRRHNRKENNT